MSTTVAEALVDVRSLKAFVREHLDDDHPLRNVILLEDDVMLATDMLGSARPGCPSCSAPPRDEDCVEN